MTASGLHPVLVCGPQIRLPLYRFLKSTFANLTVISPMELPNQLPLKNVMTLSLASDKRRGTTTRNDRRNHLIHEYL